MKTTVLTQVTNTDVRVIFSIRQRTRTVGSDMSVGTGSYTSYDDAVALIAAEPEWFTCDEESGWFPPEVIKTTRRTEVTTVIELVS